MVYLAPPKSKTELLNYVEWLSKTGHSITILRQVEDLNGTLVLAGGADVGVNPNRDEFELSLIQKAIENKWPILGVCRGMQLVNTYFGGTVEDLLTEENHSSSKDFINENNVNERESVMHGVIDINYEMMLVNSRHHQHCSILAENLKPIVWAPFDGTIEAAAADNILLVQWHPERQEVYDTVASEWPLDWLKKRL